MSANPVYNYFTSTVITPLSRGATQTCCSLKNLVYQIGTAAFSGIGNWPFYGVADSFGHRYSSKLEKLGTVLGSSELSAYFLFRLKNFQEIREKFFHAASTEEKALEETEPTAARSSRCREIAAKVLSAVLGIGAQFPIMVLVYYGNGENLAYPMIAGVCEGAFTILSLYLSLKSKPAPTALDAQQQAIVEHIDRFLEELPSGYRDPAFVRKIEGIFSDAGKMDATRGRELLTLVAEAKGLPLRVGGVWDKRLNKLAAGLGAFIALYLTGLSANVTYQGLLDWKKDQAVLAGCFTAFVSAANLKLLTKLCIDASQSYYSSMRDLVKGQYRRPLASVISPVKWGLGRCAAFALSWLSFGTTAVSARDYVPVVGTGLSAIAPLSSTLLLREGLEDVFDELVLASSTPCDSTARKFVHIHKSLVQFKEKLPMVHAAALQEFIDTFPQLRALPPRPSRSETATTPLLLEDVVSET